MASLSAAGTSAMTSASEHWSCADRTCNTGQTLLARSKYGRKVVSDFFGRNKRETKEIDADVWHMMCRKSYQRGKYNAEKGGPTALCDFYLEHITNQLERIKLWRPDAKFTIQLEKPAKERLTLYHDVLRRNGGNTSEAKQQVAVQQKTGTKGKPKPLSLVEAVKVEHAEHIDATFSGSDKTLDYLMTTVVPWIEAEVQSGSMLQMPPIEFLLNQPVAGETIIEPTTNYDRWVAHVDGTTFTTPPTSPVVAPVWVPKLILKNSPPKPKATTPKRAPKLIALHNTPKKHTIKINPQKASRFTTVDGKQQDSANNLPLSAPRPAFGESSKKSAAASDLPLYIPPPPISKKPSTASDLPLYVPPPIAEGSKKRKRPSSVDTALANSTTVPAALSTPGSAYTLVDVPPMMRRGMVYGGGTKMYVLRSEMQNGDESEIDCESPLSKKFKV